MFDCVLQHAVDVSADFAARQYESEEGEQLSISLSVTYLTSYIPDFTGSIEVEIIAEDLPSGDTRQNALFGKHLYLLCIYNIYTSYVRTYIHYTHHTYKLVTACSVLLLQ